ncbi:hypothetical protein BASA81_003220 [Batrachochytrium salamandrivorans]|nr:hypothetical protein BASA81_003220 [Batrachochytrium salamandrivorans]
MRLLILLSLAAALAKQLAGDGTFFLVLQTDGQVFGVGQDLYGQLGFGSTSPSRFVPVQMKKLASPGAVDLAAGGNHACLVEKSGQAKCVGSDAYGQLGDDGAIKNKLALVAVKGLGGVAQIAAGGDVSCAILAANGAAKCWGRNDYGMLGSGDEDSRLVPAPVVGFENGGAEQISIGSAHVCVLATTKKIWCAGSNRYGQIGDGTSEDKMVPTLVLSNSQDSFVSVALGLEHTCAATVDGTALCWGRSAGGQLGTGTTTTSFLPIQVRGIAQQAAWVHASTYTSFVRLRNGTAVGFGNNWSGELGTGRATTSELSPVLFASGVGQIAEIRGGQGTTCVVLQGEGGVQCLGENWVGQMGVGETTSASLSLLAMQGLPKFQTVKPTGKPVAKPSKKPTKAPTSKPTKKPTVKPTKKPIKAATAKPTKKK